jgi:hypothetical protein
MTLTLTDVLRFRREWTPQQILTFAERIVNAASSSERQAILAEFKANLPDPANDAHPQVIQLQSACNAISARRA